jgi:hypothetical protein
MTGSPLLVAAVCVVGMFGFGFGLAWLLLHNVDREPGIDMSKSTNDDRATASPEETLERAERLQVDPAKFTTGEIQNLHRMLAAEMATRPSEMYLPRKWVGER